MFRILILALALCLPTMAFAQSGDRGFIQGLLENALSAEGRTVRIEGFAGALSTRATIDRIAVSDPDGVWLTAEDVALVWRRSALLAGRIEIDEISVGRLSLPRGPVPVGGLPEPEARPPFSLPDLPVSVALAQLSLDEVVLGASLLGERVVLSATGSAQLAGGAGELSLEGTRLDRPASLSLSGDYDNATRALTLDLSLDEPQGGLASAAIGVPEGEPLSLALDGSGTATDFAGDLRLVTSGTERLTGNLRLVAAEDGGQRFDIDAGGDLAPLLAPDYREFLGPSIALDASGTRDPEGAVVLEALNLEAAALRVEGTAAIAAAGWPDRFDLTLAIDPPEGGSVVLPLSGPVTRLSGADLTASFDAETRDRWTLAGRIDGFARDGISLQSTTIDGSGTITSDPGAVDGALNLSATGIALDDPARQTALGDSLQGSLRFDWQRGAPLLLSDLDLGGADYGLRGAVEIAGMTDDAAVEIRPDVALRADRLERFADLAGVALNGAATLTIAGTAAPISGAFDLSIDGDTQDLATGIAQLDPLLAGAAQLTLVARRDETGVQLAPLRIVTDEARIEAEGRLGGTEGTLRLDARIAETARAVPGLFGPTALTATAEQRGKDWALRVEADAPAGTRLTADGILSPDAFDGAVSARVDQLTSLSELAGRPLSGSLSMASDGRMQLDGSAGAMTASGAARDLSLGDPTIDGILSGETEFDVALALADRVVTVDRLTLDGRNLTASGSGQVAEGASALRLEARLADTALALPGLDGATALTATAEQDGTSWDVAVTADAPGQTRLDVVGTLAQEEFDGTLSGRIGQLAAFSRLAGQRLSGTLSLDADGRVRRDGTLATLTLTGQARDIAIGDPVLDAFLRGRTDLALDARLADGALTLNDLQLDGRSLDATASGTVSQAGGSIDLRASVADLSPIAPELAGPARVSGTVSQSGNRLRIDLDGTGPGGITLSADGTAARDFSRLSMALDGAVPLALANRRIAPRSLAGLARFDLRLDGPPALTSLRGRIVSEDARLALPTLAIGLDNLALTATLGGGQAQIDGGARLRAGGRVSVSGPIGLAAPFRSDLAIELSRARFSDGSIYTTSADGQIALRGPLAGGATISGDIFLGESELRIPSIGPSFAILEGLSHNRPPPDVRRTLMFAGLGPNRAAPPDPSDGLPLDLTISARSQIFVRGRGLDAELGGSLRLRGTTAQVVPQGQFTLVRGRLDLLGQRLSLSDASVALRGNFDPVLDFVADADADGTQITIRIAGLASAPELTITSSPDLPQDELLSLLLFGEDVTQISALQAVQLAAAIRTLSGQGGGLTEQLRSNLNVDELDVSTNAEGTAQARVGAYISDNVYTQATVTGDGDTRIDLNLDITDEVTVRGGVDNSGQSSLGIFFERDY